MEIINYAKAGVIHQVISRGLYVLESVNRLRAPYFVGEPGATLDDAKKLDAQQEYEKSLVTFQSIADVSLGRKKVDAIVGAAQQAINMLQFKRTVEILGGLDGISQREMTDYEVLFFAATKSEKMGWVADGQRDYLEALERFKTARRVIRPLAKTEEVKVLDSTCLHFMGRAFTGLGNFGIDREMNYRNALNCFDEDLGNFLDREKNGEVVDANIGFQHQHKAEVLMRLGDLDEAEKETRLAQIYFMRTMTVNPESGTIGHHHWLGGNLMRAQGKLPQAMAEYGRMAKAYEKDKPRRIVADLNLVELNLRQGRLMGAVNAGVDVVRTIFGSADRTDGIF